MALFLSGATRAISNCDRLAMAMHSSNGLARVVTLSLAVRMGQRQAHSVNLIHLIWLYLPWDLDLNSVTWSHIGVMRDLDNRILASNARLIWSRAKEMGQ